MPAGSWQSGLRLELYPSLSNVPNLLGLDDIWSAFGCMAEQVRHVFVFMRHCNMAGWLGLKMCAAIPFLYWLRLAVHVRPA